MRVAPIGWAFAELHEVLQEAERSAAVTHDHPDGIRGARAVAGAVWLGRNRESKAEIARFLTRECGYRMPRNLAMVRELATFDVTCSGTVPPAVRRCTHVVT